MPLFNSTDLNDFVDSCGIDGSFDVDDDAVKNLMFLTDHHPELLEGVGLSPRVLQQQLSDRELLLSEERTPQGLREKAEELLYLHEDTADAA